jgi:hypothetical protein
MKDPEFLAELKSQVSRQAKHRRQLATDLIMKDQVGDK